jgi:hypothetical protein
MNATPAPALPRRFWTTVLIFAALAHGFITWLLVVPMYENTGAGEFLAMVLAWPRIKLLYAMMDIGLYGNSVRWVISGLVSVIWATAGLAILWGLLQRPQRRANALAIFQRYEKRIRASVPTPTGGSEYPLRAPSADVGRLGASPSSRSNGSSHLTSEGNMHMDMLLGERVLTGTPGAGLVVTTHRVRHYASAMGSGTVISIMLNNIASCGILYMSQPWLLALAGLAAIGFLTLSDGMQTVSALAAVGLGVAYFMTRRQILSIASAGSTIRCEAGGLGEDRAIRIVDLVEGAMHKFHTRPEFDVAALQPHGETGVNDIAPDR